MTAMKAAVATVCVAASTNEASWPILFEVSRVENC
jgi:hypothetical protein